jgi:hypothetical protein
MDSGLRRNDGVGTFCEAINSVAGAFSPGHKLGFLTWSSDFVTYKTISSVVRNIKSKFLLPPSVAYHAGQNAIVRRERPA